MRRQQLKEIISNGESFTVEFKRKFTSPEKICREIIAFANSSGGMLIIGVDDDKTVVGVKSEKEEMDQVAEACEFYIDPPLEPEIEIVNIEYKDVIVVHIDESDHKPHKLVTNDPNEKPFHRKAFIRQGDKSITASREMVRVLASQSAHAEPLRIMIGRDEKNLFDYLDKNDRVTVKEFAKLVNISERRAARKLVQLVRAGVLAIHTHEQLDYYTLFG
jgi:predicted HTH transcriptional regulator